jgi:hypothetical protein
MMTAIEIFEAFGIVAAGIVARAALVIGVILLLSVPFTVFAYTVRAAQSFWNRHHHAHHAHGVA